MNINQSYSSILSTQQSINDSSQNFQFGQEEQINGQDSIQIDDLSSVLVKQSVAFSNDPKQCDKMNYEKKIQEDKKQEERQRIEQEKQEIVQQNCEITFEDLDSYLKQFIQCFEAIQNCKEQFTHLINQRDKARKEIQRNGVDLQNIARSIAMEQTQMKNKVGQQIEALRERREYYTGIQIQLEEKLNNYRQSSQKAKQSQLVLHQQALQIKLQQKTREKDNWQASICKQYSSRISCLRQSSQEIEQQKSRIASMKNSFARQTKKLITQFQSTNKQMQDEQLNMFRSEKEQIIFDDQDFIGHTNIDVNFIRQLQEKIETFSQKMKKDEQEHDAFFKLIEICCAKEKETQKKLSDIRQGFYIQYRKSQEKLSNLQEKRDGTLGVLRKLKIPIENKIQKTKEELQIIHEQSRRKEIQIDNQIQQNLSNRCQGIIDVLRQTKQRLEELAQAQNIKQCKLQQIGNHPNMEKEKLYEFIRQSLKLEQGYIDQFSSKIKQLSRKEQIFNEYGFMLKKFLKNPEYFEFFSMQVTLYQQKFKKYDQKMRRLQKLMKANMIRTDPRQTSAVNKLYQKINNKHFHRINFYEDNDLQRWNIGNLFKQIFAMEQSKNLAHYKYFAETIIKHLKIIMKSFKTLQNRNYYQKKVHVTRKAIFKVNDYFKNINNNQATYYNRDKSSELKGKTRVNSKCLDKKDKRKNSRGK